MLELPSLAGDPLSAPVRGARPASPRPLGMRFGIDQAGSALRRARRLLWSRGLLDFVEPVALLAVPGGWRLLATFHGIRPTTAARLLVAGNLPLIIFADDHGVVECVVAPREGRAASGDPDQPPATAHVTGEWTHAVTLVGGEGVVAPPSAHERLDPLRWLASLGELAGMVDMAGLQQWDPDRPELLAWCTSGAQRLYEAGPPSGTRFPRSEHRVVGLWDAGPQSHECFQLVERRGGHGLIVRVPYSPLVLAEASRGARIVRRFFERAKDWQRLAEERLAWSRLVIEVWRARWPERGLKGRVQAAVLPAGGVPRVARWDLDKASSSWWGGLKAWAAPPSRKGRSRGTSP